MSTPPHSKIINKVAREILKPIGVLRKGQSRTWFDDNGWWLSVIEFQPSSWSKGTYLNVGVNFQWYPKEHFSFDMGYREAGFIEYETDEQFTPLAKDLAEQAKLKVIETRQKLSSPEAAKNYIIEHYSGQRPNMWANYNQGVACAVAGDKTQSISFLQLVVASSHDPEWAIKLKSFTADLISKIESGNDYITYLNQIVTQSRVLKKLEASEHALGIKA